MKIFVFALVAAVFVQVAVSQPNWGCHSDSCSSSSSDCSSDSCSSSSSSCSSSSSSCSDSSSSCSDSSSSCSSSSSDCSDSSSDCCDSSSSCSDSSSDCHDNGACHTQHKHILLHRQRPIIVRPPASRININHRPVVVRQRPVVLHHQSSNPTVIKPILIKEREFHPKPVHFKIREPKLHTGCAAPQVHVSKCGGGCGSGCGGGCC